MAAARNAWITINERIRHAGRRRSAGAATGVQKLLPGAATPFADASSATLPSPATQAQSRNLK